MYDWPELEDQHRAFAAALGHRFDQEGLEVSSKFVSGDDLVNIWTHPKLLLGQTCGYPFATRLYDQVQYVGTPCYDIEGCGNGTYRSAILVRKGSNISREHFSSLKFGFNSEDSWSGYRVVVREMGDPDKVFHNTVKTNGHRQSIRDLFQGHVDIVAIDAVCWHFVLIFDHEITRDLEVLSWTKDYPALPLITNNAMSSQMLDLIYGVVQGVIGDHEASEYAQLGIKGLMRHPVSHYQQLAT